LQRKLADWFSICFRPRRSRPAAIAPACARPRRIPDYRKHFPQPAHSRDFLSELPRPSAPGAPWFSVPPSCHLADDGT